MDYIRHYAQQKSDSAKLVIAGCISSVNPDSLGPSERFYTVSPTSLSRLDEIIRPSVKFSDVPEPNRIRAQDVRYDIFQKKYISFRARVGALFRSRQTPGTLFKKCRGYLGNTVRNIPVMQANINPFLACDRNAFYYLRISKGCLGSCSYCAKRYATGRLESKELDQIVDEFKAGLAAGQSRYYLLTEDAGCYGIDRAATVIGLLQSIFDAGRDHDFSLVISNFNAQWFITYFAQLHELIRQHRQKIMYIQIPIQSGSDRILERMNRQYRIKQVEENLRALRGSVPDLKFATDIIVGFPGETELDFAQTRRFLERIRFDHVDIFGYEKRPHTKAAQMDGHLDQGIIDRRVRQLAAVQNAIRKTNKTGKKLVAVAFESLRRDSRTEMVAK